MKTVITSGDRSIIDLAELRTYKGLFRYLSLRDVIVRYKQTRAGFAWSVMRPLMNIVIFGCLSYLVERSASFSEKFVAVSAGIVFWQFISTTVTDVSNSLSANAGILSKVYFPKIILPFSSVLVCLLDFLIAFALFLLIYFFFRGLPPVHILLFPVALLLGLVFSMGLGLFAATASVRYRDVKFILPFILQLLFYASPVFLSSVFVLQQNVPQFLKVLYQLNPLVFIINFFKFCMFGNFESFNLVYALWSLVFTFLLMLFSTRYFLKFEKSFADYI
jgi:lipopolysaccharide transport system permease protein